MKETGVMSEIHSNDDEMITVEYTCRIIDIAPVLIDDTRADVVSSFPPHLTAFGPSLPSFIPQLVMGEKMSTALSRGPARLSIAKIS